jgi:hypothetical protein
VRDHRPVDHLVLPPAATTWRIEPADFEASLVTDWPGASVRPAGADPAYVLWFTLPGPPRVDGALARDGQMLGLDGDLAAVARVAVWFRGLVPPEQPLLFCDPALDGRVELAAGAHADALARAYLSDAG